MYRPPTVLRIKVKEIFSKTDRRKNPYWEVVSTGGMKFWLFDKNVREKLAVGGTYDVEYDGSKWPTIKLAWEARNGFER